MNILNTGQPLSFGFELECYSLIFYDKFLDSEIYNYGYVIYKYNDKNYKFLFKKESSVQGWCIEMVSIPEQYPASSPSDMVNALYELEANMFLEVHKFSSAKPEKQYVYIHTILLNIKGVITSSLIMLSLDVTKFKAYLSSQDSRSHCQINLGFSARQDMALEDVGVCDNSKIVSFESGMLKLLSTAFQEEIVCNGVTIDYNEKGEQLQRDVANLVGYFLVDIHKDPGGLAKKLTDSPAFFEKFKWICLCFMSH